MIHGGDIYTDGVLKGKKLIDFSSNINPLGIPQSFREKLEEALTEVVNYPDIQYRELRESLSRYERVQKEYFILGNGAAEIIDLCVKGIKKIVIPAPSFAEYKISAEKYGNMVYDFHMSERKNGDGTYSKYIDYKSLLECVKSADGLILANPNNPDGSMLDKDEMENILRYCEDNHKRVIIDEAFIHFTLKEHGSFVELTEKYKCLVVIKALTKYYGMPGIRFGYGITQNNSIREEVQKIQNPWNINSFAEMAAKTVIFDMDYDQKSKAWIRECRDEFVEELLGSEIFQKVYKTNGNYVLCELKDIKSSVFYQYCLGRGFVIRNADNYTGLTDRHIRVAIKNKELNKKLIEMLNS